jgi:hypothetical protein
MTGVSGCGKQLAAAAIGVTVQGPMQSLARPSAPCSPRPAGVTAHEQALADLLTAGDPPGLGPEASSPPPRA